MTAEATSTYTDDLVSFTYPHSWARRTGIETSPYSRVLTYLSTAEVSDPCKRFATGRSQTDICSSPAAPARGVLVTWSVSDQRFVTQDRRPGMDRVFAHTRGRLDIRRGGPCRESIVASFVLGNAPTHDELLQMQACLNGAGIMRWHDQVLAMLDAVVLTPHAQPLRCDPPSSIPNGRSTICET